MHRIRTCFDVHAPQREIDALRERIAEGTSFDALPDGGARISADGPVDLLGLAEAIRTNCPSVLPVTFTYSTEGEVGTPGAFGGGYVLVDSSRIESQHVASIMQTKLSLNRSEPLGAVQIAAVEAYSKHDDGHMAQTIAGMKGREARAAMTGATGGDTLGAFVLCEAGDAGDRAEAAEMMRSAARTLVGVADELDMENPS